MKERSGSGAALHEVKDLAELGLPNKPVFHVGGELGRAVRAMLRNVMELVAAVGGAFEPVGWVLVA